MNNDYLNNLAVQVGKGDNEAINKLLAELNERINNYISSFFRKIDKDVLIEDRDDIRSMLQYQVIVACEKFDQNIKEDFLPRAYQFWRNSLGELIKPLNRKNRYLGLKMLVPLDRSAEEIPTSDSFVDEVMTKIDFEMIVSLDLNEKQKAAVNGCLAQESYRSIAENNPHLFKHHNEVLRCLEAIGKQVKEKNKKSA